MADAIREARGFGDVAENAEFQFALDEQAHLEAKISRLRDRIKLSTVVDPDALPDNVVGIASLVEVEDESGERLRLRIAAPDPEAHVATLDSPLGRAARVLDGEMRCCSTRSLVVFAPPPVEDGRMRMLIGLMLILAGAAAVVAGAFAEIGDRDLWLIVLGAPPSSSASG
jgi:hypothetical protein